MADLCTNPGFEVDTSGWTPTSGETVTRVTSQAHSGVASGEVVTNASTNSEGAHFQAARVLAIGEQVTTRVWVKGTGIVRVWAGTLSGGLYVDVVKTGDITLTGSWTQYSTTATVNSAQTHIRGEVRTSENQSAQAVTFYIDDMEIIVPDEPGAGASRNILMTGVG